MRRLLAAAAIVTALGLVLAGSIRTNHERLRHLAVPVLLDPSRPPPPGERVGMVPPCRTRDLARVHSRVTAILQTDDDALWIGTFDSGLYRALANGVLDPAGALEGRERFVNDLAQHDGVVWVATQSGMVALDRAARRIGSYERGTAVNALAQVGSRLYAGTTRGLFAVSVQGGAEEVDVVGPRGESIRVTALTASGDVTWIGSPAGAYSVPTSALAVGADPVVARWHPLVFGDPPAETNTVTALAPFGSGAVAGTDDGGIVEIEPGGSVHALRFVDRRANEVSPGAAAPFPGGAAFGTQGGGLLLARAGTGGLTAASPERWRAPEVTAVRQSGATLLVGTAAGEVFAASCSPAVGAVGLSRAARVSWALR